MIKKRGWFDVRLELLNQSIQLCASESDKLINQTIKYDLTKLLKGKGAEACFLVKRKDQELHGLIYRFKLFQSYVKRLIGRGVSIVQDSFFVNAKDVRLRVKPWLMTRKKVHRAVRKELRKRARAWLEKTITEKTRAKLFQAVLSGSIQKALSRYLKKVYPLAACELRIVELPNPQQQLKI